MEQLLGLIAPHAAGLVTSPDAPNRCSRVSAHSGHDRGPRAERRHAAETAAQWFVCRAPGCA